ncbi:uncharacterized protein ARMOST_07758 [Armillaria ostoyae]|uniref:Uncharacterized protein n=1 Tax=Armillaria ostoyae TaxID=47428 RepID=A0A284R6R2_ARMOS|nr:uncharacterized protein ARMOST_07758 [Armillaria ostoyae]
MVQTVCNEQGKTVAAEFHANRVLLTTVASSFQLNAKYTCPVERETTSFAQLHKHADLIASPRIIKVAAAKHPSPASRSWIIRRPLVHRLLHRSRGYLLEDADVLREMSLGLSIGHSVTNSKVAIARVRLIDGNTVSSLHVGASHGAFSYIVGTVEASVTTSTSSEAPKSHTGASSSAIQSGQK